MGVLRATSIQSSRTSTEDESGIEPVLLRNAARPNPTLEVRHGLPALLGQIAAFGRVLGLYPATHERVRHHRERLEAVLKDVFTGRKEPLMVASNGHDLVVNGRSLGGSPALSTAFAAALHERGIRALVMRPGVEIQEVEAIAELLRLPIRALLAAGGVEQFLNDRKLPHVALVLDHSAGLVEQEEPTEDPVIEDEEPQEEQPAEVEEVPDEESEEVPEGSEAAAEEPPDEPTENFAGTVPADLRRRAEETLRAELVAHDSGATAAATICRLLPSAQDPEEYNARRSLLISTLRKSWFNGQNMRGALCHLVGELPQSFYEDPTGLILEIGARAGEEAILEAGQRVTHMHPNAVRKFLDRLEKRREVFDLLFFLVRAALPGHVKSLISSTLVRIARQRRSAFEQWALANRGVFLHRESFAELLRGDSVLIGPVVKEILLDRRGKERDLIINLLVSLGGEKALRLLILGLRYAEEFRDAQLIGAIGKFAHPLALAVLREIVHRCNTATMRVEEAEAALLALRESKLDAAHAFLWEVCCRKSCGFMFYRRGLRRLAEQTLAGRASA